jgi:hypothetical protein
MYSELSNKLLVLINKVNKYIVKVSMNVVIINYINKIKGVLTPLQEIELSCIKAINNTPVIKPRLESFLFPDKESLMINYSWLDYFLGFEDTPGHCVNII